MRLWKKEVSPEFNKNMFLTRYCFSFALLLLLLIKVVGRRSYHFKDFSFRFPLKIPLVPVFYCVFRHSRLMKPRNRLKKDCFFKRAEYIFRNISWERRQRVFPCQKSQEVMSSRAWNFFPGANMCPTRLL